jgi:DNA invertase Pin-like site-specific DNA recombinase
MEVAADLPRPRRLRSQFESARFERTDESVSTWIGRRRRGLEVRQICTILEAAHVGTRDVPSARDRLRLRNGIHDTSLPSGELVFQMIGAVAQFERSLIAERVKSGLANARAKGKVLGRPSLRKLSPAESRQLKQERAQSNIPFRALAQKFGVSVWTAHRLCSGRF